MEDTDVHVELSKRESLAESDTKVDIPASDEISTATKKRSTSDQSDGEPTVESAAKRRRVEEHGLQTPPPEQVVTAVLDTRPAFNDELLHLLRRVAALVLERVGFDGSTKEALEELCGEIDSYATKFLSFVTESMLSARRSSPTPLDFEYALRREGLTAKLLKPHLKPPILADRIKPLFVPVQQQEQVHQSVAELLGEELSGESDKRMKAYIPKQFPSFPSKHTYKSTEVKLEREMDPRKIREKATEEARHGEEALRRLVNVGKAGDYKSPRKAMEKASKQHKRHRMWEEAMEDLAKDKPPTGSVGEGGGTEERSILVNAEEPYSRRRAVRRKALS